MDTPTTQTTTAQRVSELIAKQFRLKTTVRPSIEFKSWIGASDADLTSLQMALEVEFGIAIYGTEIRGMRTVGDCIDLVERAVSGRQS